MWVKTQNFLFLLCCAFIGKFLYSALLVIIISLSLANHWLLLGYYMPYLQIIANCFYPLAVIIGLINLFYTRFSLYIYQSSCLNFPKLQWYALFLGWILIGKEFLTEIQRGKRGILWKMSEDPGAATSVFCWLPSVPPSVLATSGVSRTRWASPAVSPS